MSTATRFNIRKFSKKIQRRYSLVAKYTERNGNSAMLDAYRACLKIAQEWRALPQEERDSYGSPTAKFGARVKELKRWPDSFKTAKQGYTSTEARRMVEEACTHQKAKQVTIRNRLRAMAPVNRRARGFVGIEIECYLKRTGKNGKSAQHLFDDASIGKGAYLHGVEMTVDGSLRAPEGYEAWEFRIFTNTQSFNHLDRFFDWLKDSQLAPKVNARCGLHVHVNLGPFMMNAADSVKLGEITKRGEQVMPLMQKCLHPMRRNSFYAAAKVGGYQHATKYFAINTASFSTKGTVEFRAHSGTVDPDKIKHWARFCEAVMFSHYGDRPLETPADLLRLDLPRATRFYLAERMRMFSQPLAKLVKSSKCKVRYELDSYGNAEKLERLIIAAQTADTFPKVLQLLPPIIFGSEGLSNAVSVATLTDRLGCSEAVATAVRDHLVRVRDSVARALSGHERDRYLAAYWTAHIDGTDDTDTLKTIQAAIGRTAGSSGVYGINGTLASKLMDQAGLKLADITAKEIQQARGPSALDLLVV